MLLKNFYILTRFIICNIISHEVILLYKNLEKIRKNLNLTINDMGKIISKSPATYYKKEKGEVTTSVEEAILIARELHEDVEFLFLSL